MSASRLASGSRKERHPQFVVSLRQGCTRPRECRHEIEIIENWLDAYEQISGDRVESDEDAYIERGNRFKVKSGTYSPANGMAINYAIRLHLLMAE